MLSHVTRLKASGIYGRFNLEQEFQPGVNIIYGKNGTGKTTFLHILANVLNADYRRFVYLQFDSVEVGFDDGRVVVVVREPDGEEDRISVTIDHELVCAFAESEVKQPPRRRIVRHPQGQLFEESNEEKDYQALLPADYFPAFRTMIEAWASLEEESVPARYRARDPQITATHLARELFGKFVPKINYPSPLEIEQRLSQEIRGAIYSVSLSDQELLSRAFLGIFDALFSESVQTTERPEMILDQIKSLSESLEGLPVPAGFFATPIGIYDQLKRSISALTVQEQVEPSVIRILDVYRDTLVKRVRVQTTAFIGINKYLDAVNEFLDDKKMVTRLQDEATHLDTLVRIEFNDQHYTGLETLSSGERQIVTLIYAATHMRKQRVVLIDEPEISLHVDWQRLLLKKMSEQLQDRQVIACTHSPMIAADYKDHLKELVLIPKRTADYNLTTEHRKEDNL